MAIEVGTLLVSMQADVARLSADMGKARRTVDDAMGGIKRSAEMASTALGLIGVGVSAAAFTGFIKSSIDAADRLNDLSKVLGLMPSQLAGIGFAAEQSGSDLEGTANAVSKLAENMGKDAEKFKKVGIDAKDPIEAFKQLADVFNSIEDPQMRAAFASEALGKSWKEAAPLLAEGGQRIGEMVEKGTEMSGNIDDLSKNSDIFKDKLSELQKQIAASGGSIANDLLPGMIATVDELNRMAKSGSNFLPVGDAIRVIFETLVVLGANVGYTFKVIGNDIGGMAAQLAALARGDFKAFADINRMIKEDAAAARKEIDAFSERILHPQAPQSGVATGAPGDKKSTAGVLEFINPKTGTGKKTDPFKLENEAWVREKEFQIAQLEEMRKAQEDSARKRARAVDEANRIIFNTDPIARANAEWQHLLELQAAVGEEMLSDETIAKEYAQTFGESTDQMTVFAEQAGRNIQDAFAEFLFDPFKGGLDGMITGFEQTLRRMAAQAIASSVMDSVGAWGKTGGGAGSFIGDLVGSVFGGKRASGGPVSGGVPYLVGERGPELFVPQASGNIVPNDKMGRSITVIQNFNLSQPADRRTQEQVAAMAGAAIQQAMARGA